MYVSELRIKAKAPGGGQGVGSSITGTIGLRRTSAKLISLVHKGDRM